MKNPGGQTQTKVRHVSVCVLRIFQHLCRDFCSLDFNTSTPLPPSFFLMRTLTSPLEASACKPPACIFSFSPLECSSYRRNPGSAHRGHSVPAAHHQPRYVAWCSAAAVAVVINGPSCVFRVPLPPPLRPSRSAPAGVSRSQRDSVHHPADPAADPPAAADAARRRAGTCHTAGNRLEVLDR